MESAYLFGIIPSLFFFSFSDMGQHDFIKSRVTGLGEKQERRIMMLQVPRFRLCMRVEL